MKLTMLVNDTGHLNGESGNLPAKLLVSSTLRNFWDGEIIVFRQSDTPLYKVERKSVSERIVSLVLPEEGSLDVEGLVRMAKRAFLFQLAEKVQEDDPDHWLVIADAATLVQRNIEYLFPHLKNRNKGVIARNLDVLWASAATSSNHRSEGASTGFLAIRANKLEGFLLLWERMYKKLSHSFSDSEILFKAIRTSGLVEQQFERGEVLDVDISAMNWGEMQRAGVLTFPRAERREQIPLIQALYFGLFYGDYNGLMINTMEG